uniref:Uncharacterized protein n=1 Tax=Fagus sylvatica TaxID=28930 RepID=A0A2N9FV39_FAGSY
MASSSNDPDSLVTLRFHDFRVERMRHWWTLLGEDDHADIVGFFGKFPSLSCGYELIVALARGSCFFLGPDPLLLFHWGVLRPEIIRPEETWRKANISLDLLTKYFSRSDFPVELARDFIAGKKGWKKVPNQCLQDRLCRRQGEGVPMFCTQLLPALVLQSPAAHFYRLQTPYHFERTYVSGLGRSLGGQQCGCLGLIVPLFDGVPLPGVWGCTGYYPSLALRQFGGVQYPPRLGDLDAVTFDYIPGEDMWRLLFRIEDIWGGRLSEMVLIEEWSAMEIALLLLILSSGERGGVPSFTLRPTVRPGASYSFGISLSSGFSLHWASEREESAARVESHAEYLASQQCGGGESSPRLGGDLGLRLREQLETEQVERTRVQDELDSLRSYTQALVDPATRLKLDLVHDALESNASWLNQEGFPVVTALHQISQVMDSLGARARAVLEEHDEGDPALSTALGRFCRETCIRLGH